MKNFGIVAIIGSLFGIGYAVSQEIRERRIVNKLDMTIEDISKSEVHDIKDTIIERAVERAVDREAKENIKTETEKIVKEIKTDMKQRIKHEVELNYDMIKNSVSDKVANEVSNIDILQFRDSVTKKAEEAILKKFYNAGGLPRIYEMFGASQINGIDYDALAKILDKIPMYDRESVIKSIFGEE